MYRKTIPINKILWYNMRLKTTVTRFLILIFCGIVTFMVYLLINRINSRSLEEEIELNETNGTKIKVKRDYNTHYINNQDSPGIVRQLKGIQKTILEINDRQRIYNNKYFRYMEFHHTVLVIRVHPNITYLSLFFDSIRRIHGIRKCFLIFAHDYFDEEINKAIRTMPYARALQIFYPYSIQLHPHVFPGDDSKYCHKLDQCNISRQRDPVLSQEKLFWWWVVNQVFDHINCLKNYYGYIYFFETNQYLTRDFIVMAKLLERVQPKLCPDCRILSLGARPPRSELYRPSSVNFIISAWGWSEYSNSGFGFNRETWDEIKRLRQQFCYFRDPSWENSLKHLASKTHQNRLYTLSLEAPRFFPLTGCGAFRNGTNCDLNAIYLDVIHFIATITYWQGVETFSVKLNSSSIENEVEARGRWGDARDMDFCMFFSSGGRRLYY